MADIRELIIRLDVQSTQAEQNLRTIEDGIKRLQREFSQGAISADKYDKEMRELAHGAAEAREGLRDLQKQTDSARTAMDRKAASADKLIGLVQRYIGPAVLGLAIQRTVAWADSLSDLSDNTGISIDNLQKFERAAGASGKTLESVTDVVFQMSKRLGDGDKSAVAAVGKLGLSLDRLKTQDPADTFLELAKAISGVQDPYDRAKLKTDLFGKASKDLDATLRSLEEEMRSGLPTASEASVRALGDLSDAFSRATITGKAFLTEVLGRMVGNQAGVLPGGIAAFGAGAEWGQQWVANRLGVDRNGRPIAPTAPGGTGLFGGSSLTLPSGAPIGLPGEADISELKRQNQRAIEGTKKYTSAIEDAAEELRRFQASVRGGEVRNSFYWRSLAGMQIPNLSNPYPGGFSNYLDAFAQIPPTITGMPNLFPMPNVPSIPWANGVPFPAGMNPANFVQTGIPAYVLGMGTQGSTSIPRPGFGSSLGSSLTSLAPQAIMSLMQGGNVGSTLGGLGGGALGAAVSSTIATAVGGTLGATLGSVVPVVGTLLGSLAGKWIGGMFGPSAKAREDASVQPQIDQLIQQTIGQYGGMSGLMSAQNAVGVDVIGAFGSRGKQGYAELVALVGELATKHEDLNKRLETQVSLEAQLTRLREEQKVTWQEASEVIARRGLSAEGLGGAVLQGRTTGSATSILNDTQTLIDFGADVGGVLSQMREDYSALVRDAIKYGTDLPENMRPFVEELFRSGHLLDGTREKAAEFIDKLSELGSKAPSDIRQTIGELKGLGAITDDNRDKFLTLTDKLSEFKDRIPSEMRPFIDQLLASAALIRENKDTLVDLTGLQWGEPVKTEADKFKDAIVELMAKLDELIESIKKDFPNAVKQGVDEGQRILDGTEWRVPDISVPESNGGDATPYMHGGPVSWNGITYAARGGFMRGTDAVLAALTPGEFVMSRESVKRIGRGRLESANRGGDMGGGGAFITVDARGAFFDGASSQRLADMIGDVLIKRAGMRGVRVSGVGA